MTNLLPGLLNTTRLWGELYEHIGDSLQAIASYRTMQQLATRLGYETIAIAAHRSAAMVLLRLDRRTEALSELAAAREIVAHSQDPWVSDEFHPILDTAATHSWE